MSATLYQDYAQQVEQVAIAFGTSTAEKMIDLLPVSPEEQSALWLLAWLTDSGRPTTRRHGEAAAILEEQGRVLS